MRELLVIGGKGNMSGMCADSFPDDMLGLIRALDDSSQYKQVVIYPAGNFLHPPDDPEILLPLLDAGKIARITLEEVSGEEDLARIDSASPDELLAAARNHTDIFHQVILRLGTLLATELFYETFCSFTALRPCVACLAHGYS
jgi:hypothetical protein